MTGRGAGHSAIAGQLAGEIVKLEDQRDALKTVVERLTTRVQELTASQGIAVERVRGLLRLLGHGEITPQARRMFEQLCKDGRQDARPTWQRAADEIRAQARMRGDLNDWTVECLARSLERIDQQVECPATPVVPEQVQR